MKRTIKIKFVDFWKTFSPEDFIITKILKTKYDVQITENADYVFFSSFGLQHLDTPDQCIKIFYTGEDECPDFNLCDYAISFEWLNFGDRHLRVPLYNMMSSYIDKTLLMERKHEMNNINEKTSFCSFVVSNSSGNPIRKELFDIISAYKKVDSGGKYLNNIGGPIKDKLAFDKMHKFVIACENGSHIGYTTEKIVEAFAAQTIPIYWGDPNITKIFNPKAFINVSDYPSIEEVVERIKQIDQDDDLYAKILKEPALQSSDFSQDNQIKKISDFLDNIISQPLDIARRHNRGFWQNRYLTDRIIMRNNKDKNKYYYLKKMLGLYTK